MTCTTTDLDLGIWMLQRCAMDGNAWAQAVLDELQRLAQIQRPDDLAISEAPDIGPRALPRALARINWLRSW